jgi:hypothetical protein
LWIEVEVSLERFLFVLRVGFVFPAARTPIRACDRSRSSNLINAISVEEECKGVPNLSRRTEDENVRFKCERTYVVIGPHELTRRHERSETEQGKYHGQT